MKLEISYAGDTSTLLPKVDPLFKIRKVDLKGKQGDKTATEFREALAVLLGRKADYYYYNGLLNIQGLPHKNGSVEQCFIDMTNIY